MRADPVEADAVRILHFSDIHLGLSFSRIPQRDLWGKRLIGAANLLRGRNRQLADAASKVEAIGQLARSEAVDLVVCTGDLCNLGTDAELAAAREAIAPLTAVREGFVVVPGNHDLYGRDTVRERRFEAHFGDLMDTDLPEHGANGPWPLVRLAGATVAVVSVNSARPNPQPWKSSGRIPEGQLAALARVLDDPRVSERTVLVATHYAPRRQDGRPDRIDHRLVNADRLLAVCRTLNGVILCGHIHRTFALRLPGLAPAIYCAGSATIEGREGLWVYDIHETRLYARRGSWRDGAWHLEGEASPRESAARGPAS